MSTPYSGYCDRCDTKDFKPHKPIDNVGFKPPRSWEWVCTRCIEPFDQPLSGARGITYFENPE